MKQIEERDKTIDAITIKNDKDKAKYKEINEKLVNVAFVERRLRLAESQYINELRKVF